MTISVVGTGYVGLVTGAIFADFGNKTFCIDIDQSKIDNLKDSKIPFYEPGLAEVVRKNISDSKLFFTTDYKQAIPESSVVFICVGTPSKTNGDADLSYVLAAIEETIKNITKPTIIVIKSTVPVGADEDFEKLVPADKKSLIEFASCPEFLREGSAVEDAIHPDRVVIGVTSESAAEKLKELYKPFNSQVLICDLRSAQMIKYAANTFLATKISFANMVANLCEELGADVELVLEGASMDKRIGRSFFYPGVGYGGSCFPKDVSAFIASYKDAGLDATLFEAVENINKAQASLVIEKAKKMLGDLKDKTIAILGLAFKPNTDDLRQAPSLVIIKKLLDLGAKIKTFDPVAMDNAKKLLNDSNLEYSESALKAFDGVDLAILVTEWDEFKTLNLAKAKEVMKSPNLIDGRNIYDPAKTKSLGFNYSGIGRK